MNKIAHIYIIGQIGSTEDSDGVELQDIVLQMEAQKDADVYHVHINSGGGDVETGRLIAEYLAKQSKPVMTIAEILCGSIATEIHLAVALEDRKIVAGTKYFIHNPLIQSVSGDAKTLSKAAEYVKVYEKEMLAMYVKATGTDKAAIEGLMAQETSLTDEQAKTLGFVSEIIEGTELKAVAFVKPEKIDKSNKEDKNILNKIEAMNNDLINKVKAIVADVLPKKEEAKKVEAGMIATDGGELSYSSEGELPEVGEVVMIGDEVAPAGNYKDDNGTVIVVGEEGKVAEVNAEAEEDVEATVESLQAKIEEMEAAAITKEEEMLALFKKETDDLKASIGSDFVPKAEKKKFVNAKKK
ncbi:MAG: ATP-dependent Clp protease proteolytic subunit, partial [Cycloclasticus sp.]|nr:ATP-dependent Clp protease proteolytic subunit [Cycloclasticus sp.]